MIQLVELSHGDCFLGERELLEGSYWGHINKEGGSYLSVPLSVSAVLWAARHGYRHTHLICFWQPRTRRVI